MQLSSGLVSVPIAGPIPRDKRALRHKELLEMVCYVHVLYTREVDSTWSEYLTRSLQCRYIGTQMKPLSGNRIFGSRRTLNWHRRSDQVTIAVHHGAWCVGGATCSAWSPTSTPRYLERAQRRPAVALRCCCCVSKPYKTQATGCVRWYSQRPRCRNPLPGGLPGSAT
jgi:hypothetical protein